MQKRRVALHVATLAALVCAIANAESIYQTTFDQPSYTYASSLNGQNGWSGTNSGTVTATGVVFNGAPTSANSFDSLSLALPPFSSQNDLLQVQVTALITAVSDNGWDVIGLTSSSGYAGRAFGFLDESFPMSPQDYAVVFPAYLSSNYPYYIQNGAWQTYDIEVDASTGIVYGFVNGILIGYNYIDTTGITGIEFGLLDSGTNPTSDSMIIGSVLVTATPEPKTIGLLVVSAISLFAVFRFKRMIDSFQDR